MDENALYKLSLPYQALIGVAFANVPIDVMAMAIGGYFGVVMEHNRCSTALEAGYMQLVRDGARIGKDAWNKKFIRTENNGAI